MSSSARLKFMSFLRNAATHPLATYPIAGDAHQTRSKVPSRDGAIPAAAQAWPSVGGLLRASLQPKLMIKTCRVDDEHLDRCARAAGPRTRPQRGHRGRADHQRNDRGPSPRRPRRLRRAGWNQGATGPAVGRPMRHPAFRRRPNARPGRWPTAQDLASAARSEPPRHTSRNTTRSGATATTGNPHCVRCDASTRTDASPSPDSASVSAGPTPARPSSSPLRTLPFACWSMTSS